MPQFKHSLDLLRGCLAHPLAFYGSGAAFVLFQIYFFTDAIPALNARLPGGGTILDMRMPFVSGMGLPGWNGALAHQTLNELGVAGRAEYHRFVTTTDMAFAAFVSPIFFMSVLARIWPGSGFVMGAFVGLFDVLENLAIAQILMSYPARSGWAEMWGPWFSFAKFAFLAFVVIAVLFSAFSNWRSDRKHL